MTGQIRHQVVDHTHRADARPATPVGDAKGLVQVEVADITAKLTRRSHAHQRIHVGAVHIDAPTVAVHQCTQVLHLRLKHTMRAGVGDHHRGESIAVLLALGLQVNQVDVALIITGGDHHLHAHHLRTGRVGAVR